MIPFAGELAALTTSFLWSGTSLAFSMSGKLVGSAVVNRTRLLLAVIWVTLAHRVLMGEFLPLGAEAFRWRWLAFSSLMGLLVADGLLFQSFVYIGARLAMLMLATTPIFGVLMGWIFIGERLSLYDLAGIALTVGGVMWVITERSGSNGGHISATRREYLIGLACGLGAAVGQAGGLIASKKGLRGDFPVLSANVIRLLVATATIWAVTVVSGRAAQNFRALRDNRRALVAITGGSIIGPFLGVTLSLFAVQHASVGIASALMSLTPIMLLPMTFFLYGERFGVRTIMGTVVAVGGTAIIFAAG